MTQPPADLLPQDTLYIADRKLDIVYVNNQWVDFARSNRGEALVNPKLRTNLLTSMSGSAKARWESIYDLLLDGRLSHHEEQFNCSSPTERRIYRLRITPQRDETGNIARLVHHTVRMDHADQDIDRAVTRAAALRHNPAEAHQAYQTRVIERTIELIRFDTARYLRPLEGIGGDMVWHRGYANGVVDVAVLDVMGHGQVAGVLATQLSVMLDEITLSERSPSAIVAALDKAMKQITEPESTTFATGLLLRFDAHGRQIVASNFGHEGPIFSRGGQINMAHGPPIGLDVDIGDWPQVTLRFAEHGDRFLVFTDGIPEQFDAEGQMFTVAGLERVFRDNLDRSLAQLMDRIVEAVEAFRGSAIVKDDQTLLAMQCLTPANGLAATAPQTL